MTVIQRVNKLSIILVGIDTKMTVIWKKSPKWPLFIWPKISVILVNNDTKMAVVDVTTITSMLVTQCVGQGQPNIEHLCSNVRQCSLFLNMEMFDVRMFADIKMFESSNVRMFANIWMFKFSMFECSLIFDCSKVRMFGYSLIFDGSKVR